MKIKSLHYFSGLTISIFVGLHLFNHLCSIFSIDQHLEMMKVFRKIYRNTACESLLLLTVIIQIISGLSLFRNLRKTATGNFEKLQIWSGLYLAFFLIIHVSAVLMGRFYLHLDTNFYFGAAGINTFPINLFFIPYYTLAIFSFFGHIAAIHYKKMQTTFLSLSPAKQSKGILITGFLVIILIFYGFTNHFKGVQIPKAYKILVGR
ncbi:hypothetical protein [Chryseobacterium sp. PMSZPI]|uniref:hypothetical protein n=1 Tax=Chryseobacterium sp. PMSZPI TaxID=1033900 RepID=UPI000C34FBC9|nr:hypothetical protein [Chryseobacterium sp. PMSZPI]PKF73541.1 hypothetical protein CW752_14320 [Chryseobacterium sp. PMSZPI]